MKVKIFTNYYESLLCKDINLFIENSDVIDIKFSTHIDRHGQCFYTALIMFKDKEQP